MGDRFEHFKQRHAEDAKLEKQADKALGFLEHLRVEHGCEHSLRIIDQVASLASGMYKITHGLNRVVTPDEDEEMDKLVQKLLEIAAESPLNAGWAFVAFWEAMLMLKANAQEAAGA